MQYKVVGEHCVSFPFFYVHVWNLERQLFECDVTLTIVNSQLAQSEVLTASTLSDSQRDGLALLRMSESQSIVVLTLRMNGKMSCFWNELHCPSSRTRSISLHRVSAI